MPYYFDHNATTPVSAEALEALLDAQVSSFGNASSIHSFGQAARQVIESARSSAARWLGCDPKEIVFTSGGTESDNLALFGVMRAQPEGRRHIITSTVEHPAVLASCTRLEREGVQVTRLPVDGSGRLDPDSVRQALQPQTALVSVMHANNETGVVQPVEEIAAITREAGVLFHSDGVHAAGKLNARIPEIGADLYSISGHKLNAPKGIGILYVRDGVKLEALQWGGRHERERRAGTENVPSIAALGRAAAWWADFGIAEARRLSHLRDRLEREILVRVPNARVNSPGVHKTPNTTNITFDGVAGEAMVIALDLEGFAVSSGAACSSGAVQPSHVLLAMGLTPDQARASLRFSLGCGNDEQQVDDLAAAVARAAERLRRVSSSYTHA